MYVNIFIFSFNHRETFLDTKLLLVDASRSIIIKPKMASQTYRRRREGGWEVGGSIRPENILFAQK